MNLQLLMVQDCDLISWNLQLQEPCQEQNKTLLQGHYGEVKETSTLRVEQALYSSSLRVSPRPSALPVKVVITTWKD
jgi:hypothetical protein